jgi:hypothetical protein
LEGKPLPYQPEPPEDKDVARRLKKRKRFFFF